MIIYRLSRVNFVNFAFTKIYNINTLQRERGKKKNLDNFYLCGQKAMMLPGAWSQGRTSDIR